MLSIEPLDGNFGVAIDGVDIAGGVDDDEMAELTRALYAHRVIVLKDQNCEKAPYLTFGRKWGTPIPHVLDHMRMPGFPELLVVGNTEEKDQAVEIRNGAALWHTDLSYEAEPASATMLYSILAPKAGGETQFCDMVAAYDALDDATKARIDDLEIAHSYGAGRRRPGEFHANPIINDAQREHVPPTYHPIVPDHPVTGHRGLYALGHGAFAIRGMADEAALNFIEALKNHALQDQFRYAHRYVVGDLVIWDTLSTMHAATPIDVAEGEDTARLLWRISVRGLPEIYAQAVA